MSQPRTAKTRAHKAKSMPMRGFSPRALKIAEAAKKTPRWKVALMSLLGLGAAGCTEIQVYQLPVATGPAVYDRNDMTTAWPVDANHQQQLARDLQMCNDHIATDLQRQQGELFSQLRLDTDNFLDQAWHGSVGSQQVARVLNGTGEWYGGLPGRAQYRAVRFHCLEAENGAILYSYVRPQ